MQECLALCFLYSFIFNLFLSIFKGLNVAFCICLCLKNEKSRLVLPCGCG